MNKKQIILLCAVIACVLAVVLTCFTGYKSARREYASLKSDLEVSTAAWKQIDKEEILKELKTAKNDLRDAELTISESEEKAAKLESEIEVLEKEIDNLKTTLSP